ncbi:unnamed protein product [Brugia pahangi]|uniref:Uncharacterized protein n=1 Tax=Brugia pahangi TaxID=6280 RepID=A0A0N4T4Q4_BRUPA|nr:unnamed protein product [Brugia pahangi]
MLIRTDCNTPALISPSANHIQTTATRSNHKAGRQNDGRGNDKKKKLKTKVMKKTKLMRTHCTIRFPTSTGILRLRHAYTYAYAYAYAYAHTKCAAQPHGLTLLAFSLRSSSDKIKVEIIQGTLTGQELNYRLPKLPSER